MSVAIGLSARMLGRAVRHWPAENRDDLLREWSAELHVMAHDTESSRWSRGRRALTYSASLLFSRPDRPPPGLGRVPRLTRTAVPLTIGAYVLALAAAQRVLWSQINNERLQVAHFPDRRLALVLGAVALLPVLLAALAGRMIARRTVPAQRMGPFHLAGLLIAMVAALTGLGWALDRTVVYAYEDWTVPIALDMSYWRGRQPFGMVVSWVAWFVIFGVAARLCLAAAGRIPRGVRILLGAVGTIGSTWLVVTIGTLAQFDATGALRGEAATWFAQWLVPIGQWDVVSVHRWEMNNARMSFHLLNSWPHVLLACAAFGMAYLLATPPGDRAHNPPASNDQERGIGSTANTG